MNIHVTHHIDPATLCLLRDTNRRLRIISERIAHMATQEQLTKLGTDIDTLMAGYEKRIADLTAQLAAPAPVADPAVDAIDAKVTAAIDKLAMPAT